LWKVENLIRVSLEVLKIVLPFLGGGLAGAVLNEWLRRRSGRLQLIPLIERVNRLVGPELKGFTLARVSGAAQNPRLEEVKNVREYQLTLRNTSPIHLRDVEIQFEFPTEDVEGWASRPTLSKTAPMPVDVLAAEPWKKAFRWRIPHLPSTDSIEFSFKAVNPQSEDYEVALYGTDRVVIGKSKGEPVAKKSSHRDLMFALSTTALATVVAFAVPWLMPENGSKVTPLRDADCMLTIVSSYERFAHTTKDAWPWTGGPWQISDQIVNMGAQNCTVQGGKIAAVRVELSPGNDVKRTTYSANRPKLMIRELSFGRENVSRKAQAEFYEEAQQP
jgi:hypothetical protein